MQICSKNADIPPIVGACRFRRAPTKALISFGVPAEPISLAFNIRYTQEGGERCAAYGGLQ